MQDTLHPKEPHGARATQLAPSAVTASAVGGSLSANHAANSPRWPSLSDDERLVQRDTLRHWLLAEPLVVGETRPTTLLFAGTDPRCTMDGWTDELCPALR